MSPLQGCGWHQSGGCSWRAGLLETDLNKLDEWAEMTLKRVVHKLERVQRRAAETLRRLEEVTYKERLIFVCVCLIAVFHYLRKAYREHRAWLFSDVHKKRMRDSSDKLQEGKFLLKNSQHKGC